MVWETVLQSDCESYWNESNSSPKHFGILWEDIRTVRVDRFQYVVYYMVLDNRVEVLAVIHGAVKNPHGDRADHRHLHAVFEDADSFFQARLASV
ncbi:MAG TPA: hypothetical protein VGL71_06025 [Urbifossiella sp.]